MNKRLLAIPTAAIMAFTALAAPAEAISPKINLDYFEEIDWDINADNTESKTDLDIVLKHLKCVSPLWGDALTRSDVYKDGVTDIRDINLLYNYLSNRSVDGAEYMKAIKITNRCPANRDSDWVGSEPHHPTTNGTLTRITYYSTTCRKNRTARVYISDKLDLSGDKKYPVLYILHGYWGHDNSMAEDEGCQNIIGKMIKAGECEEMIVVFPDIFASATKNNCDGMNAENNAAYDNCLNDITKDLMPYIEKNYPCKTGRDNTGVFGFSMGGREAIAMGLKYPDKFAYIGASCPAPGVQDVVPENQMYFREGYEPYMFMICAADNDQVVWGTPGSYHDIFTRHNVPHVWWVVEESWHGGPANHSMAYNFAKYAFKAKWSE